MDAARFFTDPRATREDRLEALRLMALQAPQAMVLRAYSGLPKALAQQADFRAAITPMLVRRGESAAAEKRLRALIRPDDGPAVRLELLRAQLEPLPQPHLAVDLAIWGAPEELEKEEFVAEGREGRSQLKASVPLYFSGLAFKFFDAEGKVVAEMNGAGEPSLRIDLPGRLLPDAPPGVVLGRYEPTGSVPTYVEEMAARGIKINHTLFDPEAWNLK